ncbi:MAG: hypothetical protein ABW069_14205, partial [Duganella sp.]
LDESSVVLWLVEWPERGVGALPPPDLKLALSMAGAGRQVEAIALTVTGEAWLAALSMLFINATLL